MRKCLFALVILGLLVCLTSQPYAKTNKGAGVSIVPPDGKYDGKTYEEWSARWWQWAFSMVVSENPLYDGTGELAANGQSGNVWFLCGVFINNGAAERTITVPKGKALFFPILNNEGSLVEYQWARTIDDVIADNTINMDLERVGSMSCTIDGVKWETTALLPYRVTPFVDGEPDPLFFAMHLPKGDPSMIGVPGIPVPEDDRNLLQAWADPVKYPDLDPDDLVGKVYPVVGDGYYLLVEPLAPGKHEIEFTGSTWIKIKYHITVK